MVLIKVEQISEYSGTEKSQLIFIQLEHLVARLQPDVTLLHRIEMLPDVFLFFFLM